MLVIEGPDGAGKSNLVGRLVGELGWKVASKVVDSDTKANTDLVKWVEQNINQGCLPMMYDRHRLVSEPIYGPLLRGDMEPGFDDFRWLRVMQHKFRILGPMVVFCLPNLEVVKYNIDQTQQPDIVRENIEKIYWLYFNLAASWGAPSLVWDYTQPETFGRLVADVKDWAFSKGLYS